MFRNFLFVSTMPYIPYYLLGANDNSFIMKMLPLSYNCIRLLLLCKFTMSRPITMYISFPPFLNIHPNLSNTFYMEQKKQLSRIHQNLCQGTFNLLATHEPFLVVDSERVIIHIWQPAQLAVEAENQIYIMVQLSSFVACLAGSQSRLPGAYMLPQGYKCTPWRTTPDFPVM